MYGKKPFGSRGHVLPQALPFGFSMTSRLTTKHVLHITGISHSWLYAKMKEGGFPLPDLKWKQNGWRMGTVRTWLEQHNPERAAVIFDELETQSQKMLEKRRQYHLKNDLGEIPENPEACGAKLGEILETFPDGNNAEQLASTL